MTETIQASGSGAIDEGNDGKDLPERIKEPSSSKKRSRAP